MRTYSELITIPTFEERLAYLQTNNRVGRDTFGFDRWMNQYFYSTSDWKRIRNHVILRDYGCDLACCDRPIPESKSKNGKTLSNIVVHHMNPIAPEEILEHNIDILNPEFLITCSVWTHNLITYGGEEYTKKNVERTANDTCPWRC